MPHIIHSNPITLASVVSRSKLSDRDRQTDIQIDRILPIMTLSQSDYPIKEFRNKRSEMECG